MKELGNLSDCFKIILLDSIFITKPFVCFFKLAHKKSDVLNYLVLFILLIFCRW